METRMVACATMVIGVCGALSVCATAGQSATPRLASSDLTSQPAAPHAHIVTGELIGVTANGADAFKGIPYAAPPIGDLRWRAPKPPQPWSTPRSAEDYGHSCPQRSPPEHVLPSSRGATTSEDCLTLNVWTPTQRPQQAMPVMVWIHGSGNNSGTSAQTYYDGPPSRATGPAHRQPPPTTARKSRSYLPPGLTTD